MKLDLLIEQYQKLNDEIDDTQFKKSIETILSLLKQLQLNDIPNQQKLKIEANISPYLENIQTPEEVKLCLKKLKKSLTADFGFVPINYYFSLGIGLGLALGSALGISFGVPFNNGIVYGPMIGSAIGLVAGLFIGSVLDKKKEAENRVLKNL